MKCRALLFICILVVTACVCVATAEIMPMTTYDISELDAHITIPKEWLYADRTADESNELVVQLGVSSDEIRSALASDNTYMFAMNDDGSRFLTIGANDSESNDYNETKDAFLYSTGYVLQGNYEKLGYEIVKTRLIGENPRFVKIIMRNEEELVIKYITVKNKQNYVLTFSDYDQSRENEDEQLMDTVALSLKIEMGTGVDCRVDQVGMNIIIPNDLTLLSESERNDLSLGMKYSVYAYSPKNTFRVHVDIINDEAGVNSLNALSAEEKQQYIDVTKSMFEDLFGEGALECNIEEINGVTYIKMMLGMKQVNSWTYELSYVTVMNEKTFAISFDPVMDHDNIISADSQKMIESIMNSVKYDDDVLKASYEKTYADGASYTNTYKASDKNVSMTFPARYNVFWRNMPPNAWSLYATGDSVERWDKVFSEQPTAVFFADEGDLNKNVGLYVEPGVKDYDMNNSDDDEIKRYIANTLIPKQSKDNIETYRNKIIRTTQYSYVVSYEYSIDEKLYGLAARTFKDGEKITLLFSSDNEILDNEYQEFVDMLISITINDKKQQLLNESDWIYPEENKTYTILCGELNLTIPSEMIYYGKTHKEDLSIVMRGFDTDAWDRVLDYVGGGVEYILTDYNLSKYVYIKREYVPDTEDIGVLNYIYYLSDMAKMLKNADGISYLSGNTIVSETGDSSIKSLNKVYWICLKIKNDAFNTEQLMCMTAFNNYQYIVTLEKNHITDDDEKFIEDIIRHTERMRGY